MCINKHRSVIACQSQLQLTEQIKHLIFSVVTVSHAIIFLIALVNGMPLEPSHGTQLSGGCSGLT